MSKQKASVASRSNVKKSIASVRNRKASKTSGPTQQKNASRKSGAESANKDPKTSKFQQSLHQFIEMEFDKALLPIKLDLTESEMEDMAKDIMRFIPHLYLLERMVFRTSKFAHEFFEKYGQDRIVKAGNARNNKSLEKKKKATT